MKRLILGILVVFGVISSAFCFDCYPYGVADKHKDNNQKELESLKQKWAIIKASKEDESKKHNEECEFDYSTKCSEMDDKIEWLVYANEHGSAPADDKFKVKMRRDCNAFFRNIEYDISNAYGELEEKGLLNRYNNFKAEMAKCRLSGKKCVEE